jgi:hypothetical protein
VAAIAGGFASRIIAAVEVVAVSARYEHTQIGSVTIAAAGVAILLAIVGAMTTRHPGPAIVAAGLLVVLALTATLTTRVADGVLEVRMGIGLIRRRIALSDVARVDVVRNHWIWGWGIRWTPHGWLWNVSGTRGIQLTYKSGRRFRIGSDEPAPLARAVASWLDARP